MTLTEQSKLDLLGIEIGKGGGWWMVIRNMHYYYGLNREYLRHMNGDIVKELNEEDALLVAFQSMNKEKYCWTYG